MIYCATNQNQYVLALLLLSVFMSLLTSKLAAIFVCSANVVLSAASGRKQKTHPKNGCRFQTEKFPEFEERLNMFKLDFKLTP